MTRRLILMRHAKSSWDNPRQYDHQRPLNVRGRAAAKALGSWLRTSNLLPDVAVVSDSERTRETFNLLGIDCPVTFTADLYHASPANLLTALHRQDASSVLLIAHNPGIAHFAEQMLRIAPDHPRFADYPTGATLVADFPVDDWAAAQPGTATAVDFIVPQSLVDSAAE